MTPQRIRVAHVITNLTVGGAEMVLYRLLRHADTDRFEAAVVALGGGGPLVEEIETLGVPVETLGLKGASDLPRGIVEIRRYLRAYMPDVVQTWMYHADLVGGVAARLAGVRNVAWNIRNSDLLSGVHSLPTRVIARTNAALSYVIPRTIVCCGWATREQYASWGYSRSRLLTIPNGWEVTDDGAERRSRLRSEWDLDPEDVVVGRVARFDPQKGLEEFVDAVSTVMSQRPRVTAVMCGTGITWENEALVAWIRDRGFTDRFRLLGRRDDMDAVYGAIDIACSSSVAGEAAPNAIGEAMAHGVPVVTTDSGDSQVIVGETGWTVARRDRRALAAALAEAVGLQPDARQARGEAARQRIAEDFSLHRMVRRYEDLYARFVDGAAP